LARHRFASFLCCSEGSILCQACRRWLKYARATGISDNRRNLLCNSSLTGSRMFTHPSMLVRQHTLDRVKLTHCQHLYFCG
jgi:hypothetical protein